MQDSFELMEPSCFFSIRVNEVFQPRVTLIENFASHAAVQEPVDVKPD